MRVRRTGMVAVAALLLALRPHAQSSGGLDFGVVAAGGTQRLSVQLENRCPTTKVVTLTHDVPYLNLPASVTVPPGGSTLEVSLVVPADATGRIQGSITLRFPGDDTCQPRTAAYPVTAQIERAGAARPEGECWYDDATGAFDEGRRLADDARAKNDRELAKQALAELARAEAAVKAGEAAGELGAQTTSVLREFIQAAVTVAEDVLEDDPRDEPPPVIYGEEIDDSVLTYEGGFAPTQGVWQDDQDFEDFKGKQLRRLSPSRLKAELKMIVGRPSALVGMRDDRDVIHFKGTVNGTVDVPVKVRFTLVQASGERTIYEDDKIRDYVKLDGPAGPVQQFHTPIHAGNGLPPEGGRRFPPFEAGPYRIDGELIRADNDKPTGIKVSVEGEAVETSHPTVHFVPVVLQPGNGAAAQLEGRARSLAMVSRVDVPRLFPLRPYHMRTSTAAVQDLSGLAQEVSVRAAALGVTDVERAQRDVLAATLTERFGTISVLGGYGRLFILMSRGDFDLTWRGKAKGGTTDAQAYAMSRKVMVGRDDTDAITVAHELAHTFPFPWAEESMLGLFGKEWHNDKGSKTANGLEVARGRVRRDDSHPVMGADSSNVWIEQGTYWHLIDFLQAPVDPELLLVRGLIAHVDDGYRVTLAPGYQMLGEADLSAAPRRRPQDFAIVLRDNRNRVIAEYPFDPVWRQPDLPEPRTVVSFAHRVPDTGTVARVEIVGPRGAVLASRSLSARPPQLRILSPGPRTTVEPQNDTIRVAWDATDPDGNPLLFNVLYSADDGRRWETVAYEQSDRAFTLRLRGRPRTARIKVVATDGMRSVERETTFSVRR